MTRTGAEVRHRHTVGLVALLVVVLGLGAACSGDDEATDAVNFTGTGSATLEVDDTTLEFTVACETTDPSGEATLLVSGSGDTAGEGSLGLEVSIDQQAQLASVGANRAPDDPDVVRAVDAEVEIDDERIVITGTFTDESTGDTVGEGILVVDGCTPG